MKKIKAAFFDLDGTLIDSEHFHYECWNDMLKSFNIHISYEEWTRDSAGIALPMNAARLVREYDLNISPEELVKRRLKLTEDALGTREVATMPYAREMVEFLSAKEVHLCVVTSSLRPEVDLVFENSSLRPYFEHVITRDDVENGKPNPEPYEKAWKLYPGLEKEECVIFEDTLTGVTAGVKSGVPCFGIQQVTALRNRLHFAEKTFSDLKEARKYLEENNLI